MNFKTTYILFGALVVLLVFAAISLLTGPKKGEENKLFPGVEAKNVTRLVVERKDPVDTKLVFVRTGERTWKLELPYAANVNGQLVDRMLDAVLNARTVTKNVELSSNPAQFGLDRPSLTITLDAEGKSYAVNLGMLIGSPDSGFVYANTSENSEPVALRRTSLSALFRDGAEAKTAGELFKNVNEYRNRELLVENAVTAAGAVQSIRISGDKGEIALKKTSAGTWEYEKPAGFGEADLNGTGGPPTEAPSGVKPLLQALAAIRVNSADDFIDNVSDFKQYGLAPKPVGPTIEVVTRAAEPNAPAITATITVGKKDDKGKRIFIRPGEENVVVSLPANLLEPINKLIEKPSALRSRSLLPQTIANADAIDIQIGSDPPVELRRLADGWKLFGRPGDPRSANGRAVSAMLNDLADPQAVRAFPDPKLSDADKGFDKPSAIVTLWVNGIIEEPKKEEKKDEAKDKDAKKDEKKDDKKEEKKEEKKDPGLPKLKDPTAKLIFGKSAGNGLLYVRLEMGGVKTDVEVGDALLKDRTSRLAFLDRLLSSFTANQVSKLSFNRKDEAWVIEKEKVTKDGAPANWIIQQPAAYAGRRADGMKVLGLIHELATLRIDGFWAEGLPEKELEKIGLKPPRFQATVKLAGEPSKERTFQFGADVADKPQTYAKLADGDLVFFVRKGIVDTFQSADLLDMSVLRLDLSKVNGLKFSGWKSAAPDSQVQTLDLERRAIDKQWVTRSASMYKLMPKKVEAFLELIAALRAETFVVYGTGPKPEFKLSPADGALTVEISIEGEKDPVTLTIGGEAEGGKSFYAQSSKAPGDVFLIPKLLFQDYKTNFRAFSTE